MISNKSSRFAGVQDHIRMVPHHTPFHERFLMSKDAHERRRTAKRRSVQERVETTSTSASRMQAGSYTLAFNKPYGVLPSFTDPHVRPTLADFVKIPDVYAAGRLDFDSEGLMLLTSDGGLAHHITDPQHKVSKVYLAQVERLPDDAALERLRHGVLLNGQRTRLAQVQVLPESPQLPDRPVPIRFRKTVPTAWLQITIQEGLNRQVRKMTAAVGYPTLRLIRVAIGPIALGDLQPGQWRELTRDEVAQIRGVWAKP
jgi:23S rRNA pseudouridine2457 synthase